MAESFLSGRVVLHAGDMLEVLPTLEENSIDACCVDPPYHLTSIVKRMSSPTAAPVGYGSDGRYQRVSGGFMGKVWDGGDIAFQVETWAQVLRVLKPGAHLLAFGGTRTYGRMQAAIEDAGFEVRDTIAWVFGSGFPKSHDVSKGIDRARGDNADWRTVGQWLRDRREAAGLKQKEVAALWPSVTGGVTGCVANWELGLNCPKWEQWLSLKGCIGFGDEMDAEVWRLNGRKGTPGEAWNNREVVGTNKNWGAPSDCTPNAPNGEWDITTSATDAAREWAGWGTALKPAMELICVARKPLSEPTIAANVLKWGTGALNIDGCRIETDETLAPFGSPKRSVGGIMNGTDQPREQFEQSKLGRWPANIIHDGSEEVLAGFPETQSGGGIKKPAGWKADSVTYGAMDSKYDNLGIGGDSGSAARFFYTAKADIDDRLGSKHPTVKPLDLMQYLVRLVTPPNGTVLDCFAGTGTTGEAAFREGFSAVLIERESEYQADIRRRMALVLAGPDERSREAIKERMKDKPRDDGPLFGAAK